MGWRLLDPIDLYERRLGDGMECIDTWPGVDDLGGYFLPFSGVKGGTKYCMMKHWVQRFLLIEMYYDTTSFQLLDS